MWPDSPLPPTSMHNPFIQFLRFECSNSMYGIWEGWGEHGAFAFSSILNGRILHDRMHRVLFVQAVCQILFSMVAISISIFTRGCPGQPPSTPSPPEILLTPSAATPYPHPLSLARASPPGMLPGPYVQNFKLVFLKNENVTKFTVFPPTHSYLYLLTM